MRLLLDTHARLWFIGDDAWLSNSGSVATVRAAERQTKLVAA